MDDYQKTKEQLIAELTHCRSRVTQLEHAEAERKQLQEDSEMTARVLDLSLDLICIAGMDGYFKYVNPVWEKTLGYSQAELLSKSLLDFIHPDDQTKTEAEIEKLAAGHQTLGFENRYKRKDGSVLTISWTVTPLPEENVMYAIGRDITERKRAQVKLQESEEKFRASFEAAHVGMAIVSANGDFLLVNQSVCRILEYSQDELLHKTFVDITFPEDIESSIEKYRQCLEDRRPYTTEKRYISGENKIKWGLTTISPTFNSSGEFLYAIAHLQDITERKWAEMALLERETQLNVMYENSLNAIMIADDAGNYISVNPAAADIFGYTTEQLLKMKVGDLQTTTRPDAAERYQEYVKKGQEIGEFDFVRPDNQRRIAQYHAVRVRENFHMSILSDITERKKAERALRQSERLLKHAAKVARLGYYQLDMQTGQANWSEETFRIFGRDPSEGEPTIETYQTLLHPDDTARLDQLLDESVKEQKQFDMIYRILRPGGEIRHVHSIGNLETNPEDGTVKMFGTLQDITARIQAEVKLKANEKRFRALFEQAGDYCMILDPNTADGIPVIVDANEAAYVTHGYTREEFIGRPVADIDDDEDKRLVVERTQLIMSGQPLYVEMTHVRKDGTTFPVSVHATRIDIEGEPPLIFATEYDITARKRAEQALKDSEENIKRILNTLPATIAVIDSKGNILDVNDAWVEFAQNNSNDNSAVPFIDFNYFDVCKQDNEDEDAKEVLKGLDKLFNGDMAYFDYEYPCHAPHKKRWFMMRAKLMKSEQKQLVISHIDITARKLAEIALRESEARFKAIAANTPDHIFMHDSELRYSMVINPQLGLTEEDMLGKTDYDLLSKEEANILVEAKKQILADGKPKHFETSLISRNGEPEFFDGTFIPIFDAQGQPNGLIGYFRNVTERKQAEEAIRASRAKLDAALASMTDAIFISDTAGQFIEFNEAFALFHRFKNKAECANRLSDYPEILDVFMDNGEVAPLDMWAVSRALRGETATNAEYTLRRKDTGETWVGSYSFAPIRDDDDMIIGSVVVARDITERKQAEIELVKAKEKAEESEEKFRVLFTDSPIPTYTWQHVDDDFVLRDYNTAALTVTEGKIGNFVGTKASVLYQEDEQILQDIRQCFQQKSTVGREMEYHFKTTGKTKYLNVKYAYVTPDLVIVHTDDFTERKQAEKALWESEARYRTVVNHFPNGMIALYGHDLRYIAANGQGLAQAGLTSADLEGKRLRDVFPPEIYKRDEPALLAALQGEMIEMVVPYGDEYFRVMTLPVRDDQGNIINGMIVSQNITALKQAEDQLKESEEKYRRLFAEMGQGFALNEMIFDKEGLPSDYVPLEVNHAFEKMVGMKQEAVVGQKVSQTIPPDEFKEWVELFGKVILNDTPTHYETYSSLQDKHFHGYAYSVGEGRFAVLFEDITERKHAEENLKQVLAEKNNLLQELSQRSTELAMLNQQLQEQIEEREQLEKQLLHAQKMEAIGQLAGGIAHDFNNILVPIMGFTELGMMGLSPDHELYENFQQIGEAADRAATLTRQILAFSRQQVLQVESVNLNELVEELQKMIYRLIGEDVSIELRLDPSVVTVNADKGQLMQVLMNLVVNARDAMLTGGKITIETGNVFLDEATDPKEFPGIQKSGYFAQLQVSDTGHGMDATTKERIFDPFFTTKERGKGTGLGLSTVFGIIKQHQGNILVESEPGEGTVFKIVLPQADGTVQPFDQKTIAKSVSLSGTETILVAEDDETIREIVRDSLAAYGYTVLEAGDPLLGIDLATNYPGQIHLLVTDVIMPEMNGFELYQRLLVSYPALKVLYMSGYVDDVMARHGITSKEIKNFLQKPFTQTALAEFVRRILDQDKSSH